MDISVMFAPIMAMATVVKICVCAGIRAYSNGGSLDYTKSGNVKVLPKIKAYVNSNSLAKEDEKQRKSQQKESKQTKSTIKKLPPICSLDSPAPLQTKEEVFLNHHEKYLGYIRHTKKTVKKCPSEFRNIPTPLIHNKTNPLPAANTTIPVYTNPLAAPTHVPAVGPQQQKEATRATQQHQADLPPGKSLHFVDIDTDDVGPCGIIFDPDRTFSRADLKEYHPNAEEFPMRVQEAIIEAHGVFPKITKHLHEKHAANTQSPHVQWPYQARIEQCSITSQDTLVYTNPIKSMKQQIKYTPSTVRLYGFTLNVLARLHPCWMRALDQLANIILVTRLLPPQLKLTGRVLIDKPDSTDKRPISILHAYDSYIVAQALSSIVEKLGIYDDTIAAYRPGHSCDDCTLNHLLAVQDTLDRPEEDILLCQIDEDKEKFFDRITTELQMLPFHLMGFPPKGFIEWIAESLHNVTVLTTIPYGPVKTSFYCGI
ncbi:predicted protein [Chaetoceros tenuissimus]|uniref:Uncharacterized protein n=1 Tax=Chaetoceros tenuissimus TaxID=426638 RepID=A0AAD3HAW3_9STRA|nr:predicted protein [Chaetoceros tenuissimus]